MSQKTPILVVIGGCCAIAAFLAGGAVARYYSRKQPPGDGGKPVAKAATATRGKTPPEMKTKKGQPRTAESRAKEATTTGVILLRPPSPHLARLADSAAPYSERVRITQGLRRSVHSVEEIRFLRDFIKRPEENETIRNNVLVFLTASNVPAATDGLDDDLAAMFRNAKHTDKWRNYCVQFLHDLYTRFRWEKTLAYLEEARDYSLAEVSSCGIWSLARLLEPTHGPKVDDPGVRQRTAARALAVLEDKRMSLILREAGAQSCARLGAEKALPTLRAVAQDEQASMHFRILCVASLGQMRDAASSELLKKLSEGKHQHLAKAAAAALKHLGQ